MLDKLKTYYLFYFIPIPLFFTSSGIFKGTSYDTDSFAIPISFFIFMYSFISKKRYPEVLLYEKNILLPLLLFYAVIIFLLKIIFSNGSYNPSLLLISLGPFIISYCIGFSLKPDLIRSDFAKLIGRTIRIFSLFCLAYLIASFISFGAVGAFANRGEDSVFGLFSIYQKLVYFPTMVSCFFVISLFTPLRYKYIYSIIFFVSVLMTGSREGILICVIGILSSNIIYIKNISWSIVFKFFTVFIIIFSLIVIYIEPIKDILDNATFLSKIKNLSDSGDISAGRFGTLQNVFKNSREDFNLLIGTGYSVNLGVFGSPHNQYAEVLLRSGSLGLFVFILIVLATLRNMLINIKQFKQTNLRYIIYSFSIVFLCLLTVSFNVNVPVRAPYTSILFGFLCGFFNNCIFESE